MNGMHDLIVTFADDVNARLLDFQQHSTYWGPMDGGPTHEVNETILSDSTCGTSRIPIHLVRPAERLVVQEQPVPFGVQLLLPALQCQGLFDARGPWLRVSWFQDQWTPLVDPMVEYELAKFDFMALSVERAGEW